ncbi:MAG: phosphoglycerate kinase [Patescibacteria group bacterium]|nr:phosphoglycerate kinase [Patescibacteria group bacterium]
MISYLRGIRKLKGVAILRLDFNTEDDWRMKASLSTINFLLRQKVKILILSHKGRPSSVKIKAGKPEGFDAALSLKKDAVKLSGLLGKKVVFFDNFNFSKTKKIIDSAVPESVFVLENLRFLPGEEKNDIRLAKRLAALGDFYVNDAFAVSHRADASVAAITKFLPSYAGLEMEKEIKVLSRIIRNPQKPLVMVFGGAKISDKLGVIKYFKNKSSAFLLGGALANTLLALKGQNVGQSLIEKGGDKENKKILNYKNLFLPIDSVWEKGKILDIGPKTIRIFENKINGAKSVIWNGPMGFIEKKNLTKGTLGVAMAIIKDKKIFSVAGGGETVMFLKKHKLDKKFSFISTGGGALLDFLAGEKLPGIEALK